MLDSHVFCSFAGKCSRYLLDTYQPDQAMLREKEYKALELFLFDFVFACVL